MKSAAGVLSLGALGGVLQGCGGGGSNPPIHDKVDLVSQKFTMDFKATSSAQTTQPEGTVNEQSTSTGISTEAFDFGKWLYFSDSNIDVTTVAKTNISGITGSSTTELRQDEKVVLDANAKSLVMYSKITNKTDGTIIQPAQCKVMDSSSIPSVAQLVNLFNFVKPQVQAALKWESSDGTYDTFKGGYKGPIPAIIPGNMTGQVEIDLTVAMDKDFLLHSVTEKQVLNMPENNVASDGSATMSAASLGGPSASDMDYTKWDVPCDQATKEEASAVMAKLMEHQKRIPGASLKWSKFFAAFQAAQERTKQVVV